MAKTKKPSKNELLKDYYMLEKMSKDLAVHQKKIELVGRIISRKLKTSMKYGLIENIEIVMAHMRKAQKEIDKAKKELKRI